jgi:HNH endonuclease
VNLSELERFNRFTDKTGECWRWTGHRSNLGYGVFNTKTQSKAHRASWELHRGQIPSGMMVLHKCDVRDCVNPDHLFLGTQTDNMRDMAKKGRGKYPLLTGELNPMAKLKFSDIALMKSKRGLGLSYKAIAALFDVSAMTAYRAINGQSWSY